LKEVERKSNESYLLLNSVNEVLGEGFTKRICEEIWLSLSSLSSHVGGGDILAQNLYTSIHFKRVNDRLLYSARRSRHQRVSGQAKVRRAKVGVDAVGLAIGDCSD
jgi:hypothetical protein